ncbi:unnamed protein product [Didymodactylos carnosus]|uniref:Uncharacterized protein n=1 Tax=Didymodactylos carnosus TaxID=1234261 RepID=A0A814A8F5_9BILA|nr:unnamed protein product [Didymodactylos carnosus]CAF1450373.1 unnamed protein product [Didymodactylos carnosus]CAF3692277.1 unnamed protein product [Didymodactylos carnosus]CAF4245173.1 unnamed protein product [Didymodactylos carnosus]
MVVVTTTTLQEAVALLVATYNSFQLKPDPRSRTVRLLYTVLLNERKYISNNIRAILNELNYESTRQALKLTTSVAESAPSTNTIISSNVPSSYTTDDSPKIIEDTKKSELAISTVSTTYPSSTVVYDPHSSELISSTPLPILLSNEATTDNKKKCTYSYIQNNN